MIELDGLGSPWWSTPPAMRSIGIAIALVGIPATHASQCATVLDGSFLEASTWDCGCDPLQCDTLIINHTISLSADLDLGPIALLVNQGSLTGPWRLDLSGALRNMGTVNVSRIRFSHPASIMNESTLLAERVTGITASFNNAGDMVFTDSLDVFSTTHPLNSGTIDAPIVALVPLFTNTGAVHCSRLHFGTLQNEGEILCRSIGTPVNPVFNSGLFHADTLEIGQYFENGASAHAECSMLYLTGGLDNHGVLRVYGVACNGFMGQGGDLQMFTGASTEVQNYLGAAQSILRGPSTLCIAEHSENHGTISGPIGICDISPNTTNLPYMDLHDGNVLPPVYGCSAGDCSTVGMMEYGTEREPNVFPQPAFDSFSVQLGSIGSALERIRLISMDGKVSRTWSGPFGDEFRIAVTGQASGIYSLQAVAMNGRIAFTLPVMIAAD